MSTQVLMPALSPTMEEGTLAKWLVHEGQEVKAGDIIAEIETDKATMEVEAVDEGRLEKILVPAGTENVKVNTPIALIAGEDEAPVKPAKSEGPASPLPGHGGAMLRMDGERSARTRRVRGETVAVGTPSPRPLHNGERERPRGSHAAPSVGQGEEDRIPAGAAKRADPLIAARARDRARHRDGHADGARSPARRHGRGDAARPGRVPHGRGGRAIPGRLQGQPGPLGGVRRQARHRYAHHRAGLRRRRRRRGVRGPQTHRRVHDLEFRHAGDRPDRQLGGARRTTCRAAACARPSSFADPTAPPPASPPNTANATRRGMRTYRA